MSDLLRTMDRFSDSTENLSLYIMQIAKLAEQLNGAISTIVGSIQDLERRVTQLETQARQTNAER